MSGEQPQKALSTAVTEKLQGGQVVTIRPMSREDIELEREFLSNLSPDSRRFRFHGGIGKPTQKLLEQLTDIDHDQREAFIAVIQGDNGEQEIGQCRYAQDADGKAAECAVVVGDDWQKHGLGMLLVSRLIESARARGIQRLYSTDAADNHKLNEIARKFGWECHSDPKDPTQVIYSFDLTAV
ncbi:GNAT family N-acetyltransferase [Microbulbifer marinus]|uniref:Acetyltransferase n=1 Tax=Microbulbifer marinus TaxID=658218 RepID=A0A1H3W3V2_9GAMM|nr:GNAT family N-acetyltransferase [Microbulbifer marinus]SDZ81114.1 acetyltransferase [Microbulbifer marinus]